MVPSRILAFVTAACSLLLMNICNGSPPTSSEGEIDFASMTVDLATTPSRAIAREILVYGGTAVTAMRLKVAVRSIGANSRVSIGSGMGTLIHEATGTGEFTTNPIPGNLARVKIDAPSSDARPEVVIQSLIETRQNGPAIPVQENQLANQMRSVPLQPNQSADFAFPASQRTFFFTFTAPHAGTFDVGYFGPGELRVRTPDFPLIPCDPSVPAACAEEFVVPAVGTSVPFRRISIGEGNTIHLAATNVGNVAGRGRVVVMPTAPQQALSFPSDQPLHFMATAVGVDRDPAAGTRGVDKKYDCVNYAGTSGLAGPGPLAPPRIPAPCYDTHEGTDWPLALGPAGQLLRASVTAAASGVVLAVDATNADMCFPDVTRPGTGAIVWIDPTSTPPIVAPIDNFVLVRHDDGLLAYYVHGLRGGAVVVPGQRVACGELLTPAASAGFSSAPHLHFELQDIGGPFPNAPPFNNLLIPTVRVAATQIDPFSPSRWASVTAGLPSVTCP